MYVSVTGVARETNLEKTVFKDMYCNWNLDANVIIKPGECYMSKPFCKNLQKIDRNKTGKFSVCKCYLSGDKTHFKKTALLKSTDANI